MPVRVAAAKLTISASTSASVGVEEATIVAPLSAKVTCSASEAEPGGAPSAADNAPMREGAETAPTIW